MHIPPPAAAHHALIILPDPNPRFLHHSHGAAGTLRASEFGLSHLSGAPRRPPRTAPHASLHPACFPAAHAARCHHAPL